MLKKHWICNIYDDVEKQFKGRLDESHETFPKDTLHMPGENDLAMKRKEAALNDGQNRG